MSIRSHIVALAVGTALGRTSAPAPEKEIINVEVPVETEIPTLMGFPLESPPDAVAQFNLFSNDWGLAGVDGAYSFISGEQIPYLVRFSEQNATTWPENTLTMLTYTDGVEDGSMSVAMSTGEMAAFSAGMSLLMPDDIIVPERNLTDAAAAVPVGSAVHVHVTMNDPVTGVETNRSPLAFLVSAQVAAFARAAIADGATSAAATASATLASAALYGFAMRPYRSTACPTLDTTVNGLSAGVTIDGGDANMADWRHVLMSVLVDGVASTTYAMLFSEQVTAVGGLTRAEFDSKVAEIVNAGQVNDLYQNVAFLTRNVPTQGALIVEHTVDAVV